MLEAEGRLARIAACQSGGFTRDQALGAGFSASQVQRRLDAGVWVRVHPRVYRHAGSPPTRALAVAAAVLWAGPGAVVSHTSAAVIWRMAHDAPDRVELVVRRARAPRAPGVVVHRVTRLDRVDVTMTVTGLPVTGVARTLIDVAAVVSERELVAMLDRALARGLVTRTALQHRLGTLGTRGRPGTARLQALLEPFGSASEHASARMAG
jgi:predicted transcriptional regulator of viral defense system